MEKNDKFKSLWKELFNDETEYITWYFENIYQEKTTRYLVEEEEVLGMMFKNKYDVSIGKEWFSSRYLVGVGVAPHRRGEGIMKKLLLECLEESRRKGEEFIYLTPVDNQIYRNFGFVYISSICQYSIEFEKMEEFKKTCKIQKISKKNCSDIILDEIVKFYKEISKDYFVKVRRGRDVYKKIFSELFCEDGEAYVSRDINGLINGYIFVLKNRDIVIKELFFKDSKCLSSLFSIIYGYKNYYSKIKIICAEDLCLEDYFKSDKNIVKIVKNKVQARITSIEKSLLRLSKNISNDESFKMFVTDEVIKENEGVYQIKKGVVEKIESEYDIEINIADLTDLIYGFRDMSSVVKKDKIRFNNENIREKLEKIFIKKVNYFNQDF